MWYKRPIIRAGLTALALVPPVVLALLMLRYSVNVPYWDEWDVDTAGVFEKFAAGRLSWGDLVAQHSEARPIFPRLIVLALGNLAHGDVRYQMAATVVVACLIMLMVGWLQAPLREKRSGLEPGLLFLSSLLIFSPAYYETWLWGACGGNFAPLACLLAGLVVCGLSVNAWARWLACVGLCLVCTYSLPNGVLCWFLLFPALFWSGNPKEFRSRTLAMAAWAGAFVTCEAAYFHHFHTPHGQRLTELWLSCLGHPWRTAQFFFCFLGGPLSGEAGDSLWLPTLVGAGLVLLFGLVCAALFRARERVLTQQALPWLALAGFSLLSAGLATSSRSVQFGADEALSSRYGVFALGLMLGLVQLVPMTAPRLVTGASGLAPKPFLAPVLWSLAGALCLLHLLAFSNGVWGMQKTRADRLLAKTCLAFVNLLPEQPATTRVLYHTPAELKPRVAALTKLRLLQPPPFTEYPTNLFRAASPPASGAPDGQAGSGEPPLGCLEHLQPLGENSFLLSGWAIAPSRSHEADGVLVTCETEGTAPRLLGVSDHRAVRSDLEALMGRNPYYFSGWLKALHGQDLPKGHLVLRAWAFDAEQQQAFPLAGAVTLEN